MDFEKLMTILPKDPIRWTFDDVSKWLNFIGLSKYDEVFQKLSIDGACLANITEEDLQNDLGIESAIIRKKLNNWLQVGIKQYSLYLKKNQANTVDQDQITLHEIPFNVFSKHCLENEFISNLEGNHLGKKPSHLAPNNMNELELEHGNENENISNFLPNNLKLAFHLEQQKKGQLPLGENFNMLNGQGQQPSHAPVLLRSSTKEIHPDNFNEQMVEEELQNPPHSSDCIGNTCSGLNANRQPSLNLQQQSYSVQPRPEQKASRLSRQTSIEQERPIAQEENLLQAQVQQLLQTTVNELIIQPTEGRQTNFYCIGEKGGKIGRHSSNEILIYEESISRHHAEIIFKDNEFFIQDIGSTTGTFLKVQEPLALKVGLIVEMGSNQFQVKSTKAISKKAGELVLQIIEGPNNQEEKVLAFNEKCNHYNIGRKQNNELSYPDDQHLSNLHAKIYYSDQQFFVEDMSSTNGSWIRLSQEQEKSELYLIRDKCSLKFGTTSTYVCKKNQQKVTKHIDENACIICCENDRDAIFLPCKHNTTCIRCSKTLKECPICRIKVEEFIKIYKA